MKASFNIRTVALMLISSISTAILTLTIYTIYFEQQVNDIKQLESQSATIFKSPAIAMTDNSHLLLQKLSNLQQQQQPISESDIQHMKQLVQQWEQINGQQHNHSYYTNKNTSNTSISTRAIITNSDTNSNNNNNNNSNIKSNLLLSKSIQTPSKNKNKQNTNRIDHCNECYPSSKKGIKRKMIFQIGFQRAGTTTIYKLFLQSGYAAIHTGYKTGFVSKMMNENFNKRNKHLLNNLCKISSVYTKDKGGKVNMDKFIDGYEYVNYFGDFGIASLEESGCDIYGRAFQRQYHLTHFNLTKWYQIIDKQYGNCSLFILNIRNVDHWLKSRTEYRSGNDYWKFWSHYGFRPIFDRNDKNWNKSLTKEEVNYYWKLDYYDYVCNLLKYFQNHENPMRKYDLLLFDLENDNPRKIADFVKPHGYDLNAKLWGHAHLEHVYDENTTNTLSPIDDIKHVCNLQHLTWVK